jgi:hypothetical protein
MKNEKAKLEKLILVFDNGHENVLWNEDYRFKMKKKKIKIKKVKVR